MTYSQVLKISTWSLVAILTISLLPSNAYGQSTAKPVGQSGSILRTGQTLQGSGTCSKNYSMKNGKCVCDFGEFEAPIGDLKGDICDWIGPGKTPLLTLFATLATLLTGLILATGVMMTVAAGYIYMTAGGNAQQVSKAKTMITAALIGIILALSAFMILNTISPKFASEVAEPSPPVIK